MGYRDILCGTATTKKEKDMTENLTDDQILWRDLLPVEWEHEKYTTGFPHIDEQHKQLFEAINDLMLFMKKSDAVNRPDDTIKLIEMMRFIGDYAQRHFRDEESLFEQYDHPMATINKEAHQTFIMRYLQFQDKLTKEKVVRVILIQMHIFLHSWLINHVLKVDTALRDCAEQETFRKKSSGQKNNLLTRLFSKNNLQG